MVVILPGDRIPSHLTELTADGIEVMAREEDGWCVANDRATHGCTIYETRPQLCRKFSMGGPACREVRDEYAAARTIPHSLT
jgi:Fe-S-cluster containining protein